MNAHCNTVKETTIMKRITLHLLGAILLAGALGACQESRGERSYVQTNVLRKDVLEGEWYYSRFVQEHNFESSYFTFRGDATWDYATSTMARIRWIIDENHLYAVRTYEIVAGTNPDGESSTFLGEPIAAFPIESHFDIQRQYNPNTGEQGIVIEENSRDRYWWERDYMRVDWTSNNVLGYYWASLDAYGELGYINRQPAALLCDEGSECPESWRVQVATAECPMTCRRAMHAPDGLEGDFEGEAMQCASELGVSDADLAGVHRRAGILTWADLAPWWTQGCQYVDELVDDPTSGDAPPYYLSLVTQEIWSPVTAYGFMCDYAQGIPCTSFRVAVRHSFLRSSNVPDYEALNVTNSMWDRFGIIRLEQRTYQRGGLPDEEEGLTREYGSTDALNYWGARHDLWADDLRLGPDGRRIPDDFRPMGERAVKPITYTLTAGFPTYLVEPSMQAAWEWNVGMMTVVRQVRNQPLPDETGGTPWGCRLEHPSCGSECDPHEIGDFDGDLTQFTAQVYQHRFAGPECALVLQTNPCDRHPAGRDGADDPGEACAEIGDIRHHFWAMIVAPGAPFSGVSLPLQDVRNGRLVSANVNITKESIERISTSFLLEMGLAAPDELMGADWAAWRNSEDAIMSGEYKREYFANLAHADHPRGWAPTGAVAPRSDLGAGALYNPLLLAGTTDEAAVRSRLEQLRPKLERLTGAEGHAMTRSDRIYSLAGTQLERDAVNVFDTLTEFAEELPFGATAVPVTRHALDEDVLDAVSPFRVSFAERIQQRRAEDLKRFDARHCFLPIDEFTVFSDTSLVRAARELGDYSPKQVAIEVRQRINKWVFMHEFGHSVGMEHNFGASADPLNYHDRYYEIASQHPYPDFTDYQTCETTPDPHTGETICTETAEDIARFWTDYDVVKRTRELEGVDSYHFSSVMDYPPEIYNYFHNLGRYDKAYVLFSYGGRREVYAGDPRTVRTRGDSAVPYGSCTLRDPADITRGSNCSHTCTPNPDGTVDCEFLPRLPMVYYLGGKRCETDSDCPFARGKGTLAPADPARGIVAQEDIVAQRCVQNYRQSMLDADAAVLPRICSNFEEDWRRIGWGTYGTANAPYFPVLYKNCGNSRVNDISWCSMFDEGSSFREVIANFRKAYDRDYLMTHFRRYNNAWRGSSIWRYLDYIGKMYQHFWYRWWYPGDAEGGDFDYDFGFEHYGYGWWDQFMASADAMQFLTYVITTPDVGSYDYDSITDSYLIRDSEEYGTGDLDLRPGLGKYMWSRYEDGLMGYFRLARQGLLRNKLEAMMALVLREWGLSYGMDERFFFNFYDLFTVEMNSLFGGIMLDNPRWFGPRMTGTEAEPRLTYPQFWKGWLCGTSVFGGGELAYCAPDMEDQYPGSPAVGGGTNVILRNYAAAFALAEFPVFFDTSYEQQMYVALDGGGDYFEIPGCDVPAMLATGTLADRENLACVVYESERLHKTYVAAKFTPRQPWLADHAALNYKSMAGELLHQMNELQAMIDRLEDPATPPDSLPAECRTADGLAACLLRAQGRMQSNESFTLSLIEMMHLYGISSWF